MKAFSLNAIHEDEVAHLWHLALAGDRGSFQKLLETSYDLMFQYGHKFNKDTELVKDAIQDVFLEILEKRHVLNRDIPPKAYLLASLRRRLHRLGNRQRWLLSGDPVIESTDFDVEFSAEEHLIQSEYIRGIGDQMALLLNGLPKRQKEVVYLRFFENLERDEIAYMMEIRPQSVSNLLQTAFKWLKIQWKPIISLILPGLFSGKIFF